MKTDLRSWLTDVEAHNELKTVHGADWNKEIGTVVERARIDSIDSTEALKMPGVLGVVDREHLDGINPRLKVAPHEHFKLTDDQDFIAIDKVRFDGDLIALVTDRVA
jgi:CO/xanthine dehydrogenase Mo-binding subunit